MTSDELAEIERDLLAGDKLIPSKGLKLVAEIRALRIIRDAALKWAQENQPRSGGDSSR